MYLDERDGICTLLLLGLLLSLDDFRSFVRLLSSFFLDDFFSERLGSIFQNSFE